MEPIPSEQTRKDSAWLCGTTSEGWGPESPSRTDFTLCFEYSIFYAAVAAIAILVFVTRICRLRNTRKPHGLGRTAWIYWPTQAFMSLASLAMVSEAVHESLSRDSSLMQVVGSLAMSFAWFLGLFVNYYEHKYTIRSSNSLFVFYILSISSSTIVLHTQHSLRLYDQPQYHLTMSFLITLLFGFIIEAWPRQFTSVQKRSGAQEYDKANFLSQATFTFYQPIVSLAAQQQMLKPADIVGILPEENKTEPGYIRLSTCWNRRVQKYEEKVQQAERKGMSKEEIKNKVMKPSLLKTIMVTHWRSLTPVVILRIVIPFTEYTSPALLGLLLNFIEGSTSDELDPLATVSSKPGDEEEKPLLYGVALAFSIFFIHTIVTAMNAYILRNMLLLGTEIQSSLVAMIYRKALRLSPDARRKSSAGAITNHMSVDAAIWVSSIDTLSSWVSLPFDFGICLFMLYQLLGWSFLAGLLTVLALVPLQLWRATIYEGLEEERLKATDERVRLTSEILSNSKIVKLYGWESAFKRKILGARDIELGLLKRSGVLEAIMSVVFASSSVLISLITFAVYVTIGKGELTPKIVFVSITLFDLLHEPVSRLAEGTTDTVSLIVATKRIQRFLLREEIDDTQIIREKHSTTGTDSVIEMRNVVLSWTPEDPHEDDDDDVAEEEDEEGAQDTQPLLFEHNLGTADAASFDQPLKPTLQNINLTINDKSLTAIVGRVGQGKSSILCAIIGEMYKLQGTIRVRGRVAYVPQQAWIINATLRDNILFGNTFDPTRYRQVIHACGLEPDLAVLSAGDLTEIGERGINLSGGQKQRVSLARATYDNADIYLLDDPLSAVDAHVDQHLWDQLIGPQGLLKDKARILVTHGIHHLEHVDRIVVVKEGGIAELGQYEELMLARQSFYQLIKDYSAKHSRKRRNSHAVAAVEGAGHGSAQPSSSESMVDEVSVDETSEVSEIGSDNLTVEMASENQELKNMASKFLAPDAEDPDDEEDELIAEEVMRKGGIEWRLVKSYVKACTLRIAVAIVLINVVTQVCTVGFSLWLKHWISKSKEELQESIVLFLGVYTAMTVVYVVFYVLFVYLALAVGRIRASEQIHRKLISTIIRLPMSFFDTTPLGRVLNRFSSDMYSIDEDLPWKFLDLIYLVISLTATFLVLAFTTPVVIFVAPIIVVIFFFISRWFLWATRSLKRINSVSISPLYQHFDESLNGISTIRAMAIQKQFIEENERRRDYSANAYTAYMYCNRWVDFRLQVLSAGISLMVALSGVFARYTIDASIIGLSLNFAMGLTDNVRWLCRDFSEWQSHLVAIERIQEYTEKHTEAPEITDKVVPEKWPEQGRVIFKNYSTRYREGLDLVIKHLSFEVEPREKVGIVGRTGAGKSSLTLALFRIIEAANSQWARNSDNTGFHDRLQKVDGETVPLLSRSAGSFESGDGDDDDDVEELMDGGSIEIDGVDISTLGLTDLRKHLAIIPQDPTLFAGTIRENLDPFDEVPDSDLWEALERAHLKSYIRSLSGGLSAEVSQDGQNFSVGQRSLICLARALLRKSKILILDEATAAVDVETDELIQRTIREEFQDRTVLTIAHRIKTVMDSTKILVMEQGHVVEFEEPAVLLSRGEASLFWRLAHQAGEVVM